MSERKMTGNLFLFTPAKAGTDSLFEKKSKAESVVERFCGGETEAFDEFYKMFAPMVHGIALAKVPREEVDDIVQDVFIAAYRNLHALKDKSAAGAWLASIARNRASEYFRRTPPTEELSEDFCGDGGNGSRAEAREILSAIRGLPEAYKETMILRLVEGMTGPEIAEKTGLTPDSVRVNLHRGMRLLRKNLGIGE